MAGHQRSNAACNLDLAGFSMQPEGHQFCSQVCSLPAGWEEDLYQQHRLFQAALIG